jgi:serpin B
MNTEGMTDAVRDLAALSTRLLLHLGSDKANLALSPLSFHSVLVLLAAGATGDTLDQIVSFLGPSGGTAHASLASHVASGILAGERGAEPDVRCAVGVWVDSSFRLRPAFAEKVASQYKAAACAMPFQEKVTDDLLAIITFLSTVFAEFRSARFDRLCALHALMYYMLNERLRRRESRSTVGSSARRAASSQTSCRKATLAAAPSSSSATRST